MNSDFYIKAGIMPSEYIEKNKGHKLHVDRQPAGLNFYKSRWGTKQPCGVYIDNDEYSFIVENVFSLSGVEDVEYLERGIYKFKIYFGITAGEFISHDEARLRFMGFLQDLTALGWQGYIKYNSDPRLSGELSYIYAKNDRLYTPDPDYTPTLDEWMSLGDRRNWMLYANNIFMEIQFRRNHKLMDKDKDGTYLISITLYTSEEKARSHFQGSDRERWQELWVEDVKERKIKRYQREAELEEQGYTINRNYVEAIIHPEDPVEPDEFN
jgi:hypothetical protein